MIGVWEVFPESFQIITGWRTRDHGARIEKKWLPKFDFIAVVGGGHEPGLCE